MLTKLRRGFISLPGRKPALRSAAVLLVTAVAPHLATATPFELIYGGVFSSQDALNPASQSTPTYFSSPTPFTINAWFDTNSPNLAPSSPPAPPPFAGFRAYAPSLATITIGAQSYDLQSISANPTAGISVAIFDQNSFTPGHYAIGILQQPPKDGAGIVGDFLGASPGFTVDALTATTFTQYIGVGYGSGVCTQGSGPGCPAHAVTPLVLHDGANNAFDLTLGNYLENGPTNSAALVAVGTPEPGTFASAMLSLSALTALVWRRRSSTAKHSN